MVDTGDAIKLETSGNQEEFVHEPDVSLKSQISFQAGRQAERLTSPKRSAGNENLLARCIAAVNKILWPSVDFSRNRTAPSGKFPEDELKAGRELVLRNNVEF